MVVFIEVVDIEGVTHSINTDAIVSHCEKHYYDKDCEYSIILRNGDVIYITYESFEKVDKFFRPYK